MQLSMLIFLLFQSFDVFSKNVNSNVVGHIGMEKIEPNSERVTETMMVENGGNATLRCVSPRPWFFCVWESPGGDNC